MQTRSRLLFSRPETMATLVHAGGSELLQIGHGFQTCHVTTSANRVQLKAKRNTKIYVVHRNTLLVSFRIQIE